MAHFDVIIIGAGISGIDASYHLNTYCPGRTYAVLERRANLGGTWDLFKYPGIRSDSDMFTFGFSFKPWASSKPIAPGADILQYLEEAVDEFHIREHIHFNTHIQKANWTSADALWSLETGEGSRYTCSFLFCCGGYYSQDEPYQPDFPGRDRFSGRVIHPQLWSPEDTASYKGKRVAIIGSGATAITLLPNIANGGAAHVVMVQRTPTYTFAAPEVDGTAKMLAKIMPATTAHSVSRWKNIAMQTTTYNLMTSYPKTAKKFLLAAAWKQLQGSMSREEFQKHFVPPYNPWEQRLCLSPAGDFFESLKTKQASIVTGHIETFTETGIQMKTGEHIDAEVIITATGLTMQRNFPMSTMAVSVDGVQYKGSEKMIYKGMMISGVPNFAFTVGYTNASWTLKADLTSAYVARLLNHMRSNNLAVCCPNRDSSDEMDGDFMGLQSGYVQRAKEYMPKQGLKAPWRIHDNYIKDRIQLQWGSLDDPKMQFRPTMSRL